MASVQDAATMKKENALELLGGEDNAAQLLRMNKRAIRAMETDKYGNLLSVVMMDRILAAAVRRRAVELAASGELSAFEADITQI